MYIVQSCNTTTIYLSSTWVINHEEGTLTTSDFNKFVNQSGDVVNIIKDKNNCTNRPYKISINDGAPFKCDFFDVFEKYYTYRRHERVHIADIKTGAVVMSLKSQYYGRQYKNFFIQTNRIINMDTLEIIEIKKQDKPHFSNDENGDDSQTTCIYKNDDTEATEAKDETETEAEAEANEEAEAEAEAEANEEAEASDTEADLYDGIYITSLTANRENSDSSIISNLSVESGDDPATTAVDYPNVIIGEKCLIYSKDILTPKMIDFVQDMSNGYRSTYFRPLFSDDVYIINGGDFIFRLEPENTNASKNLHPDVRIVGADQVTITILKYYDHVDNLPVLKIYEWALQELQLIDNLLLSVDYVCIVTPGKFKLRLFTEKESHASAISFALPDVEEHNRLN